MVKPIAPEELRPINSNNTGARGQLSSLGGTVKRRHPVVSAPWCLHRIVAAPAKKVAPTRVRVNPAARGCIARQKGYRIPSGSRTAGPQARPIELGSLQQLNCKGGAEQAAGTGGVSLNVWVMIWLYFDLLSQLVSTAGRSLYLRRVFPPGPAQNRCLIYCCRVAFYYFCASCCSRT